MAKPNPMLDPVDTSSLTDADWTEINRLKLAYDAGGDEALSKAMDALAERDIFQFINIVGAYYPDMVSETVKDQMAERGITEEDVRDLIRKLNAIPRKH